MERYDRRLLSATGPHTAEWQPWVRVDDLAVDLQDPLPPAFSLDFMKRFRELEERAKQKVQRGSPREDLKAGKAAMEYFERKISGVLGYAAPNLPDEERPELFVGIVGMMQISGREYLASVGANEAHVSAFHSMCEDHDPVLHLAWFWGLDDYFQRPQFHDDLLFRGTQLLLERMGRAERPFRGHPFPDT